MTRISKYGFFALVCSVRCTLGTSAKFFYCFLQANGSYWISYDDETSMNYKAQYINYLDLAGAGIWAVAMDDFRSTYSSQPYPIVSKINSVFDTGIRFNPENPTCGSAPMC